LEISKRRYYFFETKQLCDFILREKINPGHPLHASLMTALHILYGRPFKQQRAEAKLSEEIIPPEFMETHNGLILMRDKIYAHTDADGPKTANKEILNKIAVRIDNAPPFNKTIISRHSFGLVDTTQRLNFALYCNAPHATSHRTFALQHLRQC
jgi:hypothetical protein